MKPTPDKSQTFERGDLAKRAQDVVELVRVIDGVMTSWNVDPHARAVRVAALIRGFNLGHWIAIARAAGCDLPSDECVAAVLNVYLHRATATELSV
jgi:hypothetical protein